MVLIGTHSHMIIKTRKVDPRAEGGVRILIKNIISRIDFLVYLLILVCLIPFYLVFYLVSG